MKAKMAPTKAEVGVLRLVAEGLTDAEIAIRLRRSARTVQAHCQRLYRKTGSSNRVQLARYAVAQGLVPVEWSTTRRDPQD